MKYNTQFFFVISTFLFLISISSCEKSRKKSTLTASEADSLHTTFLVIQDSLFSSWHEMVEDDSQKIADAKRLLEEISYTDHYNQEQFDSLQGNLSQLKEMRYTSISMANSRLIDNYDSASNKIINEIIALATNHPEFERYPLMKTLIKDIQEANGRVLRHRINYDYAAKYFNQFLEDNKEILEEVDSLRDLQKKPLFEISG